MATYAFVNSDFDIIEIYETGDFETLRKAIERGKTLADVMEMDIEIFEYQFTVQPFFVYREGGMIDDEVKESRNRTIESELAQRG